MKKFVETLKDMLYDSIDYIIMIGIIGTVIIVIGWRLDLLFAKDALDVVPNTDTVVEDNTDVKPDPIIDDEDDLAEEPAGEPNDETEDEDLSDEDSTPVDNLPQDDNIDKTVKITIPAGSLPSKIGSILESNGLISSRVDFVQKAQEMKLDTKLKSGNFDIKTGSTLEEIIKLIAK